MTRLGLRRGARRIAPLAWPVFVGQVAVIAFSTVDTVHGRAHVGRPTSPRSPSAPSVYISIFVGFMGIVLAVGPIAGQLYGAGKLRESGHEVQQAMWLGLALAVPGCLAPALPGALPRPRAQRARGRGAGAPLPRRPRVRAAAGARLHRLSRLQRRGVAAEGGDGDAARRPRPQGARSTPCSSSASMRRRRSARCTCRRSASPAAASRRRSSCGASSPARSCSCAATASIAASASAAA